MIEIGENLALAIIMVSVCVVFSVIFWRLLQ